MSESGEVREVVFSPTKGKRKGKRSASLRGIMYFRDDGQAGILSLGKWDLIDRGFSTSDVSQSLSDAMMLARCEPQKRGKDCCVAETREAEVNTDSLLNLDTGGEEGVDISGNARVKKRKTQVEHVARHTIIGFI